MLLGKMPIQKKLVEQLKTDSNIKTYFKINEQFLGDLFKIEDGSL